MEIEISFNKNRETLIKKKEKKKRETCKEITITINLFSDTIWIE